MKENNKLGILITTVCVTFVVIFLIAGFVKWEMNPAKWLIQERLVTVAGAIIVSIFTCAAVDDITNNDNDKNP